MRLQPASGPIPLPEHFVSPEDLCPLFSLINDKKTLLQSHVCAFLRLEAKVYIIFLLEKQTL